MPHGSIYHKYTETIESGFNSAILVRSLSRCCTDYICFEGMGSPLIVVFVGTGVSIVTTTSSSDSDGGFSQSQWATSSAIDSPKYQVGSPWLPAHKLNPGNPWNPGGPASQGMAPRHAQHQHPIAGPRWPHPCHSLKALWEQMGPHRSGLCGRGQIVHETVLHHQENPMTYPSCSSHGVPSTRKFVHKELEHWCPDLVCLILNQKYGPRNKRYSLF